jgi:hypothetical protein
MKDAEISTMNGLMCYAIPGDAREHLSRSMKKWRELQAARPAAK